MWTQGEINGYKYFAKVYHGGSHFGINEGQISKLTIKKGDKMVYNFDRGLDFDNLDKEGKKVYLQILSDHN